MKDFVRMKIDKLGRDPRAHDGKYIRKSKIDSVEIEFLGDDGFECILEIGGEFYAAIISEDDLHDLFGREPSRD